MSDFFLTIWEYAWMAFWFFLLIVLPVLVIALIIVDIICGFYRRFERFCDALEKRKP